MGQHYARMRYPRDHALLALLSASKGCSFDLSSLLKLLANPTRAPTFGDGSHEGPQGISSMHIRSNLPANLALDPTGDASCLASGSLQGAGSGARALFGFAA
jgi:hypothetical protein